MSRAQGSRVELAYLKEVTPGTTPGSGTWNAIRKNSEGLSAQIGVIESGEIRADRESASDIQGNKNVGGNISTELSPDSHNALLESLMSESWVETDTGATTLSATGSNTFTRASGSFVTDGFIVGQWVLTSGFTNAANNGWFKVTAVVALTLTVAGGTTAVESGGGDEQISSQYLVAGTTVNSYSIAKRYRDIADEVIFAGCLVSDFSISIAPESVVSMEMTINGRSQSITGSLPAAATDVSSSNPFDSFSGVIMLDDVINTNVTALDLSIGNNISDMFVIGNQFKIDQASGRRAIGGNISFFFEDLDEYSDSADHVSKAISVSFQSGSAYFGVDVPRTYMDLPTPASADENAIVMSGPFRGKLDGTLDKSVILSATL